MLKASGAEIQEQSSMDACDTKVIDRLRVLYWSELAQCLHLDEHLVDADEIDAVMEREQLAFVPNGKEWIALPIGERKTAWKLAPDLKKKESA